MNYHYDKRSIQCNKETSNNTNVLVFISFRLGHVAPPTLKSHWMISLMKRHTLYKLNIIYRKLIQFHKVNITERQTDGRTGGRTDRWIDRNAGLARVLYHKRKISPIPNVC